MSVQCLWRRLLGCQDDRRMLFSLPRSKIIFAGWFSHSLFLTCPKENRTKHPAMDMVPEAWTAMFASFPPCPFPSCICPGKSNIQNKKHTGMTRRGNSCLSPLPHDSSRSEYREHIKAILGAHVSPSPPSPRRFRPLLGLLLKRFAMFGEIAVITSNCKSFGQHRISYFRSRFC